MLPTFNLYTLSRLNTYRLVGFKILTLSSSNAETRIYIGNSPLMHGFRPAIPRLTSPRQIPHISVGTPDWMLAPTCRWRALVSFGRHLNAGSSVCQVASWRLTTRTLPVR